MILITFLNFFPNIPMGTCGETFLKLDKLVQFFWQKTIVNDKILLQKKNIEWKAHLPRAGYIN